MAQYAFLIYTNDSARAEDTSAEEAAAHDRHAEELVSSGAMKVAYALRPRETATSIRSDVVTDGPFIDAKEVIAGFCIIEAPDLDAALDIARRNPATQYGGGVEVRPVAEGGVVDSSSAA